MKKYKNSLSEFLAAAEGGKIDVGGFNIMQGAECVKIQQVDWMEIKTENKSALAIKIRVSRVLGEYLNSLKFMLGDASENGEKWSLQPVFTQQINNLRFVLKEALNKKLILSFTFQKNHITFTLKNNAKVRVVEPQSDLLIHIFDQKENTYSFEEEHWLELEKIHKDGDVSKNVFKWYNYQTNVFVYSKTRNKQKRKRDGRTGEDDGRGEGRSRMESSPARHGSRGRGRGSSRGASGRGGKGRH